MVDSVSITVILAQAQAHSVGRFWAGHRFPLQSHSAINEDPKLHTYGFPRVLLLH